MFQTGLIFYDLEWTGAELLQIGAVTHGCLESFERTILTNADVHYKVAEKIKIETRCDGDGRRRVYDSQSGKFIPTVSLISALEELLDWIKTVYFKVGQVILVSHGSLDIPILIQNFAKYNLDDEFQERISAFVNFQDYIKMYFIGLPYALADLVKVCDLQKSYRQHSAIDDAKALHDVFLKLHEDPKKKWKSNTALVLTDVLKFGFVFDELPKVSLSFVVFEKGSKYIRELTTKLKKPKSQITYLETIQDWIGYFKMLRLFDKVGVPSCFMFHVGGWVKSHRTIEENGATKVTVIDLLCFIENIFFTLAFHPTSQATFMKRRIDLADPSAQVIPPGHLVKVKVQLKEGKEPRVMYLLPGDKEDKEVDMQKVVKEIESSGSRRNRICSGIIDLK